MKLLLFACIAFISINVHATPTCSENGTKIIYTNGVFSSEDDVKRALKDIQELNISSEIDAKKVEYVGEYNFEGAGMEDILESAVQRFLEQKQN
jgi:hypothetical protein